jgi:sugar phosphate permease
VWKAVRDLPRPYIRFLTGVGLFGLGDFAPTLLVLAAAQQLRPEYGAVRAGQIAALLYVLRNVLYALASFPVGALADRMDKQKLLAAGYAIGAITGFGAMSLFWADAHGIGWLIPIFALAGIYIGMEDALEGAIPADLVESDARGTAYGLMGAVNGVGDLAASALVGTVWTTISPVWAFFAAGTLMASGAGLVLWNRRAISESGGPARR